MKELPNLREMLEASMVQAANECGQLLGVDLYMDGSIAGQITKVDYFAEVTGASLIVGIESREEYQGKLFMVVDLRDAIVLSSTLLGIPPARVAEKQRLAIFDPDDVDAFSEIANQITGSFNTVFQPFLPKKVHLKQLVPEKYIPPEQQQGSGDKDASLPDGEYYLVKPKMIMPGFDLERFDLLVPMQLAVQFNVQERKQGKSEEKESSYDDEYANDDISGPAVLVLEDNSTDRRQFSEILAARGVKPVMAAYDADLKRLVTMQDVKAVLLGVANADEQELALCIKIVNLFPNIPAPIIMCARQWTRMSVLKALKFGAKEILLKPCSSEELSAKVMKYLPAS
jgi:CheY-like chemotaxis protein/chemotaxis protein CheY-P-specific phosphatase CheC